VTKVDACQARCGFIWPLGLFVNDLPSLSDDSSILRGLKTKPIPDPPLPNPDRYHIKSGTHITWMTYLIKMFRPQIKLFNS